MFYGNNYRYLIIFVGFWCLASVCSNYVIINFTFICMQNDMSQLKGDNTSIYDYTSDEKKWIMWAVGGGTTLGTVPTNYLVVRYGAKIPFFVSGIVSMISTVLIPLMAEHSFVGLLGLRFLQGLSYSTDFATLGTMAVRWAPLKETATFIAILTCFTAVAPIVTNPVTGLICSSSLGWKYSYYLHAIFCLLFFILWLFIYIDDPQKTNRVSENELKMIQKDKSSAHLDVNAKIPYLRIITSPVILVIWLNAFFEMSAIILFTTYLPIYFHRILNFSITETGFYVAIVLGINIPLRIIAAAFSDRITSISEKWKLRIFNSISVGISGVLLSVIGVIPSQHNILCFIVISICMCCVTLNCGGFYKCAALHARQYAHVVIAAIQFTKCLALFSAPALVAFFVIDESQRLQWIPVFVTLGVAMFVSNIISLFVFTDEPAEWTKS